MARVVKQKKKQPPTQSLTVLFLLLAGFTILVLPFITSNAALDISLYPRLLALSVFLVVFSLAMLHKRFVDQLDYSVLKKAVFPVYAAFCVVSILSLAFALNVTAGFFDVTKVIVFLVLMAVASLVFLASPGWQHKLTKMIILASLMTLAVGYYEYIDKLGFGVFPRWRLNAMKGLMSNVNLYANALMLLVPLVTYGLILLKKGWRLLAALALAGLLLMILLLQTRATYVGIMAGIGAIILVIILYYKDLTLPRKVRNFLALGTFVAVAVFSLLVLTAGDDNRVANRFKSIFDSSRDGGRTLIWEITGEMIGDHLLTGVGAGNYALVIQSYYGGYEFGDIQRNWMRPHNDFLWVFSEKGILGILLFLLFFILGFYYASKIIKSNAPLPDKWMAVFAASGLVSYMVNSVFDFPLERINQQVYLALFMAILVTFYHQIHPEKKPVIFKHKNFFPMLAMAVLLPGTLYSYKALEQEKRIHRARSFQRAERWADMLEATRAAKTPWKTLDPLAVPLDYFEGFALSKLGNIEEAVKSFELAVKQNPHRKYTQNNLANAYISLGENDKAISHANKTLEMIPNDVEALSLLATAYYQQNLYQESLEALERIREEDLTAALRGNIRHLKRQIQLQAE